jgi:hypothetical protein
MTIDTTIHLGEILVLVTTLWSLVRVGVGLRDSVRDMARAVDNLTAEIRDHEQRLRILEAPRRYRGGS